MVRMCQNVGPKRRERVIRADRGLALDGEAWAVCGTASCTGTQASFSTAHRLALLPWATGQAFCLWDGLKMVEHD